ncbi:DUF2235 domain-containing protein [Luteibacter sp. ME-Dv--P-043b]|uniref:phospholipase effector Tle1 domain-containing protein n=1 Tax=Luteibacter sp. ME-Dv--P-043b TaxID=3040291 RepID=UPI002553AB71|nr:DUF2235 domain-containing protein [Luteibacter sp. ME-Dv--P-043b]
MEVSEKHKRNKQGRIVDSVRMESLSREDYNSYARSASEIGSVTVPRMFNSLNPHARLYVANFDGTGNDKYAEPEHATNVALLHDQIDSFESHDGRVVSEYIRGAGTQENFISKTIDGVTGQSYGERIEWMYRNFAFTSKKWLTDDPEADIRVVATGFSRGAEQAAGFVRMVNELGIQDYAGRTETKRSLGHTDVSWALPPLREPGKTLMSEILFDPVGTGTPNNHDRQPTSSTVSGLQITARDERRNAFPSTQILPPGRSADGRFVGVTVPGAHSDIGGSYHQNGLSTLNFNMAADFLNAHSDVPLVSRLPEPTDPSMYVIHHSEDHMWFYGTSEFRQHGHRDIMGSQASPPHCVDVREIIACAPPDPFDPSLASQVGPRYPVGVHSGGLGSVAIDPPAKLSEPSHPDHAMYQSASVQILELHVRSGFDLEADQVDRLATGLVDEAKRQGMTEITDVRFGEAIGPGRPSLQATQTSSDTLGVPVSRSASIDALQALDTSREAAARQRDSDLSMASPLQAMPEPMRSHSMRQEEPQLVARAANAERGNAAFVMPNVAQHHGVQPERQGSDAIRSLQQNLNTLGIRDMAGKPLATHGELDMATQTAVARFQSAHALPVTGRADDATQSMVQGQAFIAELRSAGHVGIGTENRVVEPMQHSRSNAERDGPAAHPMDRAVIASPQASPSRDDPRHPDSAQHALYNELQQRLPEASEDRLLQFTAACHQNRIAAGGLDYVHLDGERMRLVVDSNDPMATPAKIDLSRPPPEAGQSIQQIGDVDRQREQTTQQMAQAQQQGASMVQ